MKAFDEDATHIVVDLETMGTSANAPITAIGAAAVFTVGGKWGDYDEFYRVVDLNSTLALPGAKIDADTIYWWLGQSEEARRALTEDRVHIVDALSAFRDWVASFGEDHKYVWGYGSSFDCTILRQTALAAGREELFPFEYWDERDLRTMFAMFPEVKNKEKFPFKGAQHNALEDAVHEGKQLAYCLDQIRQVVRG